MAARDTSPNATAVQVEIHRQFAAADRLRMAIEMSEFARSLSRAGLRARRPELTESEVEVELLKQLYGFDAMRR